MSRIVSAAITKCHGLTGWITRLTFLALLEAEVQRADPLADKNTLSGTQTAAGCHLPVLGWPLPVYTHKAIRVRGNPLSCSFYKETSLHCLTSYKTSPTILVASFDLTSQSSTTNAHRSLGTLHINFGRTRTNGHQCGTYYVNGCAGIGLSSHSLNNHGRESLSRITDTNAKQPSCSRTQLPKGRGFRLRSRTQTPPAANSSAMLFSLLVACDKACQRLISQWSTSVLQRI